MNATKSAIGFEEAHMDSGVTVIPSIKAESLKCSADHHDESEFFFKGAVFGLLLCLPFWAVVFWLII